MSGNACPLCGAAERELVYAGVARCARCGLVRTDPPPTTTTAGDDGLYGGDYFTERNAYLARRDEFTGYFATILDQVAVLKPAGRLLDVGCGPGPLLQEACRRGYAVAGCDVAAWAIDYALQHGLLPDQHYWHFTPATLTRMLREAGFAPRRIDTRADSLFGICGLDGISADLFARGLTNAVIVALAATAWCLLVPGLIGLAWLRRSRSARGEIQTREGWTLLALAIWLVPQLGLAFYFWRALFQAVDAVPQRDRAHG